MSELSRRGFLGVAGGAAAAAALPLSACADDGKAAAAPTVPFFGTHQAGIITPAQDRLHIAAFDLITTEREAIKQLLQRWTDAAAKMTAGHDVGEFGAIDGPYQAPPEDTGEALGLSPARLTITFGFGPSLFATADGTDRFGLAGKRPAHLEILPHFPADKLDPLRSNGDLCVQACSDDPQVAVHAVRNLARLAFGVASVRWSQLGFGRTSSTSTAQATPRNLFGFKDGTMNIKAEETADVDRFVWVAPADEPAWMHGGTYMVTRRINMHIETWDRTSLQEQERDFGRDKRDGAPLSGGKEFSQPDFTVTGRDDRPLMDPRSHVAVTHPANNDGMRMLRRGYNFTDGSTGLGRLDAGLFFIAFVANPATQYIPIQIKQSRDDRLMEYLQHTGSGIFAVPGGASETAHIAHALFA